MKIFIENIHENMHENIHWKYSSNYSWKYSLKIFMNIFIEYIHENIHWKYIFMKIFIGSIYSWKYSLEVYIHENLHKYIHENIHWITKHNPPFPSINSKTRETEQNWLQILILHRKNTLKYPFLHAIGFLCNKKKYYDTCIFKHTLKNIIMKHVFLNIQKKK